MIANYFTSILRAVNEELEKYTEQVLSLLRKHRFNKTISDDDFLGCLRASLEVILFDGGRSSRLGIDILSPAF